MSKHPAACPFRRNFRPKLEKKAPKKRAPLEDSGSNLPTYLGLVFGTFFLDAAWFIEILSSPGIERKTLCTLRRASRSLALALGGLSLVCAALPVPLLYPQLSALAVRRYARPNHTRRPGPELTGRIGANGLHTQAPVISTGIDAGAPVTPPRGVLDRKIAVSCVRCASCEYDTRQA